MIRILCKIKDADRIQYRKNIYFIIKYIIQSSTRKGEPNILSFNISFCNAISMQLFFNFCEISDVTFVISFLRIPVTRCLLSRVLVFFRVLISFYNFSFNLSMSFAIRRLPLNSLISLIFT